MDAVTTVLFSVTTGAWALFEVNLLVRDRVRGPYRWVRHPSYTGLLVFVAGFGLGLGNWLSLVVCALLPTVALLRRIRVEEDELTRVLGDEYDAYRMGTKRLIPVCGETYVFQIAAPRRSRSRPGAIYLQPFR